MPSPTVFSPLNWKELERLAPALDQSLRGLFLERVLVPERPRFPQGFLKGEWGLRFGGKGAERTLILSVRTRQPYLYLWEGKAPKAASQATHSGFDLAIAKHLKGARVRKVEALPRERVVLIHFDSEPQYTLAHYLIPALPELWLLQRPDARSPWTAVARSRTAPLAAPELPNGQAAPDHLTLRGDWVGDPAAVARAIEQSLEHEAFATRSAIAERALKETRKTLEKKLQAARGAVKEAEHEPDYRLHGDLLTAILYTKPLPYDRDGKRFWKLPHYETSDELEVEGHYGLDSKMQAEKYFHLARRKQRRIEEGRDRAQVMEKNAARLGRALAELPKHVDEGGWEKLQAAETAAGIPQPSTGPQVATRKREAPRLWSGRTFRSKDGLTILVGKSRDENLELTFKVARGNDMWLHLRGRPGAHVVVPVPTGKSTPLETLLDAAVLAVFYSGGENWGKTEVDYTLKKYVKRIRDSTEASYTQNKTLIVEPERERLQRLLKQLE